MYFQSLIKLGFCLLGFTRTIHSVSPLWNSDPLFSAANQCPEQSDCIEVLVEEQELNKYRVCIYWNADENCGKSKDGFNAVCVPNAKPILDWKPGKPNRICQTMVGCEEFVRFFINDGRGCSQSPRFFEEFSGIDYAKSNCRYSGRQCGGRQNAVTPGGDACTWSFVTPYCKTENIVWPTEKPTKPPTTKVWPTLKPTYTPTTKQPTGWPTDKPSTKQPTGWPTNKPTTKQPTGWPTDKPTTKQPTGWPTDKPTTKQPTAWPTDKPTTKQPTAWPTDKPTTKQPTGWPTDKPTTKQPTGWPTDKPTTKQPTGWPTDKPTTKQPTGWPTTKQPTGWPTNKPTTKQPTNWPTGKPTDKPSMWVTNKPTQNPTKTWANDPDKDRCRTFGEENGYECGCRVSCRGQDCHRARIISPNAGRFCGRDGVCCCGNQCRFPTFKEQRENRIQSQVDTYKVEMY